MRAVFDRLVLILTAIAFLAAMSIQAIPSAEALGLDSAAASEMSSGMTDEQCPRMAIYHPDRGSPKSMPCKGIMPDCVKQMGCAGSPNLTAPSGAPRAPITYSIVIYWPAAEKRAGLSIPPDLFPPIRG